MRVPVYVVCAALIVAVKTDKSFLFNGNEPPETDMGQRDYPISFELLLPRLLYAKAREQQEQQRLDSINNNRQWMPFNPYAYNNIEFNDVDDQLYPDERVKKARPSLSISNSLDVLRNHMINHITKTKMREGVTRNRCHLTMIGKRIPSDLPSAEDCEKKFLKKY